MKKLKMNLVKKHLGTSIFIGLLCASFNTNAQVNDNGTNVGVGITAPEKVHK